MSLPVINSIVRVIGTVVGVMFAGASIISIANMKVPWVGALIIAALLVPVMFVVSGIGTWLAYERASSQVTIGLIALPWVYGVIFVLAMLYSSSSNIWRAGQLARKQNIRITAARN